MSDAKRERGRGSILEREISSGSCSEAIQPYLTGFFARLGVSITRSPYTTILLSLLVTMLVGTGNMLIIQDLRMPHIYVPRDTEAFRVSDKLNSDWSIPGTDKTPGQGVLMWQTDHSNVLDERGMRLVLKMHRLVIGSHARFNETHNVTFSDICWHSCPTCGCFEPPLVTALLKAEAGGGDESDVAGLLAGKKVDLSDEGVINMLHSVKNQNSLSSIFGGKKFNKAGYLFYSTAVSLTYYVNYECCADLSREWEIAFMHNVRNADLGPNVRSLAFAARLAADESERTIGLDVPLMGVAIALIIGFMTISLSRSSLVKSRTALGASDGLLLAMCFTMSFGAAGLLGTPITPISPLTVFVLVGVGVDNLIIMVDLYDHKSHLPLSSRLSESMASSGPALVLANVTSVIAFALSSVSSIICLKSFCITSAVAIAAMLCLSVTTFAAFMVLDHRRSLSGRADCCCCMRVEGAGPESMRGGEEANLNGGAGRDGYMSVLVEMVTTRSSQLMVLALFFGSAAGSALVLPQLPVGDGEISKFFAAPSPVQDFMDARMELWKDAHGGGLEMPSVLITEAADYSTIGTQRSLHQLKEAFDNARNLTLAGPVSWYEEFIGWAESKDKTFKDEHEGKWRTLVTPEKFAETLDEFGRSKAGEQIMMFVRRNPQGVVQRTVMPFIARSSHLDTTRLQLMVDLRKLRGAIPISGTVWNMDFYWGDRDSTILHFTIKMLMQAGAAVVVTLCLFLHPRVALLIGLNLVMIDLDLGGMMWLLGLRLGSIGSLALTISIGLSVDYCAHLGISFTYARGSRRQRLHEALWEMGPSVVKGAGSTMLGLLALAWAQSSLFKTFFKLMISAVVIGALHGLVFFPVMLFFFGPEGAVPSTIKPILSHSQKTDRMSVDVGQGDELGSCENSPVPIRPTGAAKHQQPVSGVLYATRPL